MLEMMLIALPILFVVTGAIGVLSFAMDAPEPSQDAARPEASAPAATAMVFVQAEGKPTTSEVMPIDVVLSRIEEHLRQERKAAQAFASNPSAASLWMN